MAGPEEHPTSIARSEGGEEAERQSLLAPLSVAASESVRQPRSSASDAPASDPSVESLDLEDPAASGGDKLSSSGKISIVDSGSGISSSSESDGKAADCQCSHVSGLPDAGHEYGHLGCENPYKTIKWFRMNIYAMVGLACIFAFISLFIADGHTETHKYEVVIDEPDADDLRNSDNGESFVQLRSSTFISSAPLLLEQEDVMKRQEMIDLGVVTESSFVSQTNVGDMQQQKKNAPEKTETRTNFNFVYEAKEWIEQWTVYVPVAATWLLSQAVHAGSKFYVFRTFKCPSKGKLAEFKPEGVNMVKMMNTACLIATLGTLWILAFPLLAESIMDRMRNGLWDIDIDILNVVAVYCCIVIGAATEGIVQLLLFSGAESVVDLIEDKGKDSEQVLEDKIPSHTVYFAGCINDEAVREAFRTEGLKAIAESEWVNGENDDVPVGACVKIVKDDLLTVDGTVLWSDPLATYDMNMITGDTGVRIPPGREIQAGAILEDKTAVILAEKEYRDSTLYLYQQTLKNSIREAEESSGYQTWIHTFNRYYVWLLFASVAAVYYIPPQLTGRWHVPYNGPGGSKYRSIALLVGGAPCALILAAKVAYICSVTKLQNEHIKVNKIKGVEYLNEVNAVVFDKTGTLTSGARYPTGDEFPARIACTADGCEKETAFLSMSESEQNDIKRLLHTLQEARGNQIHAKAMIKWADSAYKSTPSNVQFSVDDEKMGIAPRGISGTIKKEMDQGGTFERYFVAAGSHSYVLALDQVQKDLSLESDGAGKNPLLEAFDKSRTAVTEKLKYDDFLLAYINGPNIDNLLMIFEVEERLRHDAVETIKKLHEMKIETYLASGSKQQACDAVAERLGIDTKNVYSGMLPAGKDHPTDDKQELVKRLTRQKKKIMMVGDGMNDANAMSKALVSVSVDDTGDEVTQKMAHLTLIAEKNKDVAPGDDADDGADHAAGSDDQQMDTYRVVFMIETGRHTQSVIISNIIIACVGLAIVIPASVFGLFPLWAVVVGHEGSTLLVALNSLRAL